MKKLLCFFRCAIIVSAVLFSCGKKSPTENREDAREGESEINLPDSSLEDLPSGVTGDSSGEEKIEVPTGQAEEPFTDYDGNIYQTVRIGKQVWMAENLKVIHFRNGDSILTISTEEEWIKSGDNNIPASCFYNFNPDSGKKYGMLYNWHAVGDTRNLAPDGWHIPTDDEWAQLGAFLGGMEVAGTKMKSKTDWGSLPAGAVNYGFLGLPGGYVNWGGKFESFGGYGYWWTSTPFAECCAEFQMLGYYSDALIDGGYDGPGNDAGMSLRCVKD